jgi:alkylation response protein AidB-like acyl-CoA dehydrogenase
MATIRPRDLLSESLLDRLDRLDRTADLAAGRPAELLADIALLSDAGYLNVALPPEFGGLGCTLRQAACGQRRLARRAPRTALAISAHLYWTGAAADAYRTGDESLRWILLEASRGALFAGGHGGDSGEAGGDLKFADPRSRCERTGQSYQFADSGLLSTVTPGWDWIAVHGVHQAAAARSVIAFAGRGTGTAPAFRVARTVVAGTPADIFTTSALTWGHSILASVQYSDARRAFDAALTAYAEAAAAAMSAADPAAPGQSRASGASAGAVAGQAAGPAEPAGPVPAASTPPPGGAGHWPVAEAGTRLDAMKARIGEVTHPWQLVQTPAPDVGGQHLIGLYAMRHEVAEGAARVHDLISQITGTPAPARPLV